MQEQLQRIEEKINVVQIDMASVKVDVHHHIKRSDATDKRVDRVENLLLGLAVIGVLGGLVKLLVE